jgi:hypothetical protein
MGKFRFPPSPACLYYALYIPVLFLVRKIYSPGAEFVKIAHCLMLYQRVKTFAKNIGLQEDRYGIV